MTLLAGINLSRTYQMGDAVVHAVRDVNLTVHAGEMVALVGPSGSGKSTLLALLGGMERPTSGSVTLDGLDYSKLSEEALSVLRRRKIGYIFQAFNLIPGQTAHENVCLPAVLDGRRVASHEAEAALEAVGMAHRRHHKAMQLSGGEQQRVAIARALLTKPPLILADEPTASLDSANGREIMDLLRLAVAGGQTVVMVTHDQDAAAYADRMISLRDGSVIGESPGHGTSVAGATRGSAL